MLFSRRHPQVPPYSASILFCVVCLVSKSSSGSRPKVLADQTLLLLDVLDGLPRCPLVRIVFASSNLGSQPCFSTAPLVHGPTRSRPGSHFLTALHPDFSWSESIYQKVKPRAVDDRLDMRMEAYRRTHGRADVVDVDAVTVGDVNAVGCWCAPCDSRPV